MNSFEGCPVLVWLVAVLRSLVAAFALVAYFLLDQELVVDYDHPTHLVVFLTQTLFLYTSSQAFYFSIKVAIIGLPPPIKHPICTSIINGAGLFLSILGLSLFDFVSNGIRFMSVWFVILLAHCLVQVACQAIERYHKRLFNDYLEQKNSLANVVLTKDILQTAYKFHFAVKSFGVRCSSDSNEQLSNALAVEYVRWQQHYRYLHVMKAKNDYSTAMTGTVSNHINFLLDRQKSLTEFDKITDISGI